MMISRSRMFEAGGKIPHGCDFADAVVSLRGHLARRRSRWGCRAGRPEGLWIGRRSCRSRFLEERLTY